MFENMDRRKRKTQEALYSSLISLTVERGYDVVSVQDIIDSADVGRTTFYAHFRSKNDLLMFGFQRLRDELQSLLDAADSARTWMFVESLLQHAKAHRGLYLALLNGGGGREAEREFQSVVEDVVRRQLGDRSSDRISVALLSGALIGAVRSWIETGTGDRPKDVLNKVCAMADAVSGSGPPTLSESLCTACRSVDPGLRE